MNNSFYLIFPGISRGQSEKKQKTRREDREKGGKNNGMFIFWTHYRDIMWENDGGKGETPSQKRGNGQRGKWKLAFRRKIRERLRVFVSTY